MRIILNQEEIEEGIEKLILEQVNVPDDMRIDIDLKATRSDEGYTAVIDIVSMNAPTDGSDRSIDPRVQPAEGAETLGIAEKVLAAKTEVVQPRRRGRPPGAKNKPKYNPQPNTETQAAMQEIRNGEAEVAGSGSVTETMAALNEEPAQEAAEATIEAEPVTQVQTEEVAAVEAPVVETQEAEEVVDHIDTNIDTNIEPISVESELEAMTVVEEEVAAAPDPEPVAVETQPVKEPVPVVEEVKAPEPEPVKEEEAAPAPVPATPTRSLFANLKKPS